MEATEASEEMVHRIVGIIINSVHKQIGDSTRQFISVEGLNDLSFLSAGA